MSTFEQAKNAVEGLWREELAALEDERDKAGLRASEAWTIAQDHQGRAAVLSQQLETARGELVELPGKMGVALLADDQGEIVALQGHYAALTATTAELDQALEETHAAIGAATLDMTAAEESARRLAVSENEAKQRLWDEFESLESSLFLHFARSIGADRLPQLVGHEREAYSAALRQQAQRLGKPEPGGIVIARPSPREVPEPITVRPSQLAPHRG